jgi:uncharacterized protein (TIRG00374 family)
VKGKVWIGLGVSLLCLWLAFRGVEIDQVVRSFRDVRPLYLIPVLLLAVFVRFFVTAVRWQVLLYPIKRVSLHRLFGVTMIGFMANNVLPARMGEFVRAYALGKAEHLSKSLSFATIVVERIFDGLTLLLFLLLSVFFVSFPAWLTRAAYASLVLYMGVLGGLFWLWSGRSFGPLARLGLFVPSRLRERAQGLLASFTLGLDILGHGWALVAVAALSILDWLVIVASLHVTFLAFDLSLPPIAAFVVTVVVALGVTLPSSPGFVGTYQFFTVVGLGFFSVPDSVSFSVSLVSHAIQYVPITVIGLIYFWRENLSFRELNAPVEATG